MKRPYSCLIDCKNIYNVEPNIIRNSLTIITVKKQEIGYFILKWPTHTLEN
jgi:hypothetical protein